MGRRYIRDPWPPDRLPPQSFKRWVFLAVLLLVAVWVYSGTAWTWFSPVVHKPLINKYAGKYKLDPLWVMAIIKVESRFVRTARSDRGAVGLMQLLPSTAHEIGPEIGLEGLDEADLLQPDINLNLGAFYLTKLQALFPEDDLAVLAAYNAGPGVTREWQKGKPVLEISDIEYPETRSFVRRVDRTYGALKILQGWKHLFGISQAR